MAKEEKSPNADIDSAIKQLMKDIKNKEVDPDTIQNAVRVVNVAIQWEKVKHHIKDGEEFNPDLFT